MLRKKKSFNNLKSGGVADGKYISALRDRSLEEEKLRDFQGRHEVAARHLREEELKWQKSEIRAFDKKQLNFDEEKFEEICPYETLDFDTLADVIALGSAQLNLQKVISIQQQCINLYEEEFDILDNCFDHAKDEKESLMNSFMNSITDSPFLLTTKKNFDNKIKYEKLKTKLSTILLTVTEMKEKITEYNKTLRLEKIVLDEERKIVFNVKEVITDQTTLDTLNPIFEQVAFEDSKLNEYMTIYNNYEKLRVPKEKKIEENSINRYALEFRAIYGGITENNQSLGSATPQQNKNISSAGPLSGSPAPSHLLSAANNSSAAGGPQSDTSQSVKPTEEVTDYDHLTEAIKVYEKEYLDYCDLKEYCVMQEKALAGAVKHAKSEIKYLREGRVLKSYGYYDEIAKHWNDSNAKIEKLRKSISSMITVIKENEKRISMESATMAKNFKAVTENLPNKRAVHKFLLSDAYQSVLATVKQPILKAKELHELRNQETEKHASFKNEREALIENLLKNRDDVMESINQAKKAYHKYQKTLETYDVTIKALDYGKMHGVEQLESTKKLISWLEDEQKHLLHMTHLQKQEEELTVDSIKKIETLEERIEIEKYQATYKTPFGSIMIGGGNGNIPELHQLRSVRDKSTMNLRTAYIQRVVDARARLHLYPDHALKLLVKPKPYKCDYLTINRLAPYKDVTIELKCVTKTKIVYQLDESITIHKQIHLEKCRKILPTPSHRGHNSAYALVFLPYRGKISQSIATPIVALTNNTPMKSKKGVEGEEDPTSPIVPMEKIARRKSTSIEPGTVSKLKRTHSRLLTKKGGIGGMKGSIYGEEGFMDDHSESGMTFGSQGGQSHHQSHHHPGPHSVVSAPSILNNNTSGSNNSDYSKEIQTLEALLQKLFKYEQELITDNQKVMMDVSNLLQTPAGKRLLEGREEKWLQKVFFPENEFEVILAKFELLGLLPQELRGKKLFPNHYEYEK
jgi:hypothetical protein